MPTRNSVKKIETPFDLQGSEGDEAWVVFRPMTMQEAQDLRIMSNEVNAKIEKALTDYSARIGKATTDLTEQEKERAYEEAELNDDVINSTNKELARFIVDWNWVDDEGKPLPKPKDDYKVLRQLYTSEYNYIMSLFTDSFSEKN